jgi:histone acetyltransferase SAS2
MDRLDVEEGTYGLIENPNINRIQFGTCELKPWYGSAVYFARDHKTLGFRYLNQGNHSRSKALVNKEKVWLEKLYVCDYCFKYTEMKNEFEVHYALCDHKTQQPGKIQYKDVPHTIRRVRGSRHKLFAQDLCLFTKLFLDSKSMFFTVDFFDFYVIYDNETNKPMGFFSKELLSTDRNNLACILVFPPYQRRHLGTLLIAFSYELSKAEKVISGPEKPLSPFGLVGYLRYWSNVLCRELLYGSFKKNDTITLDQVSKATGIRIDDITITLKHMELIVNKDNKLYLQRDNLQKWASTKSINMKPLLKRECLLI